MTIIDLCREIRLATSSFYLQRAATQISMHRSYVSPFIPSEKERVAVERHAKLTREEYSALLPMWIRAAHLARFTGFHETDRLLVLRLAETVSADPASDGYDYQWVCNAIHKMLLEGTDYSGETRHLLDQARASKTEAA